MKQCNSVLLWIYSQLINVTQWGGKLAPERWNCLIVEFSHAYKYKFVTLTFLMHQVKRYLKIVDMQSTTCHMLQCSAASSLFKHRDHHQIRFNVSDWLSQTKIAFPLVETGSGRFFSYKILTFLRINLTKRNFGFLKNHLRM